MFIKGERPYRNLGQTSVPSKPQSIISLTEEQRILQQTLPAPPIVGSFLSRNAMPIFLGGTVLLVGLIGLVLMIKV